MIANQLIEVWRREFGDQYVAVADVLASQSLVGALTEISGKPPTKMVGKTLAALGFVSRRDTHREINLWAVPAGAGSGVPAGTGIRLPAIAGTHVPAASDSIVPASTSTPLPAGATISAEQRAGAARVIANLDRLMAQRCSSCGGGLPW